MEQQEGEIQNDANDVIKQEKPKKPRTQKQLDATARMLEGRKKKQEEQLKTKEVQYQKQKVEEEKIKEKIVKKAINLQKKKRSKIEILELIESDDEEEDEPEVAPQIIIKPTPKPKIVKQRVEPQEVPPKSSPSPLSLRDDRLPPVFQSQLQSFALPSVFCRHGR
jgi:hypothetical protein